MLGLPNNMPFRAHRSAAKESETVQRELEKKSKMQQVIRRVHFNRKTPSTEIFKS